MKDGLVKAANKIKDKLIDRLNKYCAQSVKNIHDTYQNMANTISSDPQNEKELVDTRAFIDDTPKMMEEQELAYQDVSRHYDLLN
jgi:hypothetical protein